VYELGQKHANNVENTMQSLATLPLPALPAPQPEERPRAARRLLWTSFWLIIVAVVVGQAWDGYWHITNTFDGFWSPPHVFVYAMSTFAGLFVAALCFVPRLRHSFGPGLVVPGLPFALPGALFLLAAGFVALGVASMVVDNLWHTVYGLNETLWSLPHAMIGAALCLMTLGFTSCRLALRAHRPLRWPTALLLGVLLLGRWRRGAWLGAGVLFGVLVALLGGSVAWLLAPLAAPAMLAGTCVGGWAFDTLERPTVADVWGLVLGAALGLPLISGGVDLWLRSHTTYTLAWNALCAAVMPL